MVHSSIGHEPKRGFDLGVCAAFLGLAAFWTAVGFTVASLL
ncbi:MAG TPA: hypothetical protein VGI89_10405 [Rhizomicrobium sp.]|jgi:hypothetical protein